MKDNKKNLVLREEMSIFLERSPRASSKSVSKSMRSNAAKNTGPEKSLRKALYSNGIRGYRLNWRKAPGRPDICFPRLKLAIFVNGCFWHRCPRCDLPLPKTNNSFWEKKFRRNIERDRLKRKRLEDMSWRVLTIWECDVKGKLMDVVKGIENTYKELNEKKENSRNSADDKNSSSGEAF